MQRFLNQFIPFIFIGIAMVAFAFGVMLFAYLFFFGAIVGLILYFASWIRQRFFSPKDAVQTSKKRKQGRTIDSDDWKKL